MSELGHGRDEADPILYFGESSALFSDFVVTIVERHAKRLCVEDYILIAGEGATLDLVNPATGQIYNIMYVYDIGAKEQQLRAVSVTTNTHKYEWGNLSRFAYRRSSTNQTTQTVLLDPYAPSEPAKIEFFSRPFDRTQPIPPDAPYRVGGTVPRPNEVISLLCELSDPSLELYEYEHTIAGNVKAVNDARRAAQSAKT